MRPYLLLVPAAGFAAYKALMATIGRLFAWTDAEIAATRASTDPDRYLLWLEREMARPYDVEKDGL